MNIHIPHQYIFTLHHLLGLRSSPQDVLRAEAGGLQGEDREVREDGQHQPGGQRGAADRDPGASDWETSGYQDQRKLSRTRYLHCRDPRRLHHCHGWKDQGL